MISPNPVELTVAEVVPTTEESSPRRLNYKDFSYQTDMMVVGKHITGNRLEKLESFKEGVGGSTSIVAESGNVYLIGDYRPALPVEVRRNKAFSNRELTREAPRLLDNLLLGRRNSILLKRTLGSEVLDKFLESKEPKFLKLLFLTQTLDFVKNNINIRHADSEIRFARKHNPTIYDKCGCLPILHPITYAISSQGNSGSSHMFNSNMVLKILSAAKQRAEADGVTCLKWSDFTRVERSLCDGMVDVFLEELGVRSVIRVADMDKMIDLVRATLYLKPLGKLTLEDDEWIDHGYVYQNVRDGEVFKDRVSGRVYYPGIALCDNDDTFRGFFSGFECRIDYNPDLGSVIYHVYLQYPFEVEVGTTPDGSLKSYAYIPPRITLVPGETLVRKWDGSVYTVSEVLDNKDLVLTNSFRGLREVISQEEYLEVGHINDMPYPMWLALPPDQPITFLD